MDSTILDYIHPNPRPLPDYCHSKRTNSVRQGFRGQGRKCCRHLQSDMFLGRSSEIASSTGRFFGRSSNHGTGTGLVLQCRLRLAKLHSYPKRHKHIDLQVFRFLYRYA